MKKRFFLSFQQKVIVSLLVFMNVAFFLTACMTAYYAKAILMEEKKEKLMALATMLAAQVGPGGYEELYEEFGLEDGTWEEKITVLNVTLGDITDTVSYSAPEVGAGFYCRELDAIVTYGPSEQFSEMVGIPIGLDHPGRIAMRDNQASVASGKMIRGEILNAMVPIERRGVVIGYTWANEPLTAVNAQFAAINRTLFGIIAACFALTAGLLFLLSRRTVRDVDLILTGVRAMRTDMSRRIEGVGGNLGEIAHSINEMAGDIGRAKEESDRAASILQNVLDNVEAVVYVCDPHSKKLVYTNKYLSSLFGGKELNGRLCYKALHGEDAPCSFCPQRQLFDSQGTPILTPLRWEHHNTKINRDFMVLDRLVTWHDGRLLHMEVATDVTERNALALAEASNQAQKDFVARMSHEIRTPMNGVLGMTRLALLADPPPAQLEYLKKIESSAAILLGIINDILDFSRIEAGKLSLEKRPFNLHEAVENVRELILPRIKEHDLDFFIEIHQSVPQYLMGDGLRLSQVLLNLLGNASKFTLAGSITLRIFTKSLPSERIHLVCEVEDTGIGMTEEEMAALFNPFSQADSSTSRKFGGTGLGLSISKALVELMNGTIGVRSHWGKGSVFFFTAELEPVQDNVPVTDDSQRKQWEEQRYDGHSILLVEDNEINQEIALSILSDMGAEVDVAENGVAGLNAFRAKDYSLIFMDVRMPIMDGLEATRRIRSSGKHDALTIPIIAMTANAMKEDRIASMEAGMNEHIAKPIDIREVQRVLFEWLGEEELGPIQ